MATVVESTQISLPQIVDVAMCAGEGGVVNFQLLHTLLHVLVQQMALGECKVEFRGADSSRLKDYMQAASRATRPEQAISMREYTVVGTKTGAPTGAPRAVPQKGVIPDEATLVTKLKGEAEAQQLTEAMKEEISRQEVRKEKVLKVIQQRKNSKEEIKENPEALEEASPSAYSLDKLIVVEKSGLETPTFTVTMTKDDYENAQNRIKALENKVQELVDMPTNKDIIGALRSTDTSSPIVDLFQVLTLLKRMDAAEVQMSKLASLIGELLKGNTEAIHLVDINSKPDAEVEGIVRSGITGSNMDVLRSLERRVENLENMSGRKETRTSTSTKKSSVDEDRSTTAEQKGSEKEDLEGQDLANMPVKAAMSVIQNSLDHLLATVDALNVTDLLKELDQLKDALGNGDFSPPESRLNKLEEQTLNIMDQLNSLDTMYNHQNNEIQNHLDDLDKEIAHILETMNAGGAGTGPGGFNEQALVELCDKIVTLQEEITHLSETVEQILSDKDERNQHISALLEQVELLKQVKADREDLDDALADKADACQVSRKVSHSQFNAACDDLSKGIEEALAKLTQQEIMWQTALEDITREIGSKLDKIELAPLRDFINNKLKNLQEKFKTLTALKKEQEAAGTKSKFLRNVNCISCDKDVVMRKEMDASLKPQAAPLPPARSMGPYLAYELDQLRKQQKCLPKGKNLNYVENALQTKPQKERDHICNRYCGGSHTITTPQQRVTRLGHFLQQYGPEIVPVNETMVKGADGHMYRAREELTDPSCPERPSSVGAAPLPTKARTYEEKTVERPSTSPPQKISSTKIESLNQKRTSTEKATSSRQEVSTNKPTGMESKRNTSQMLSAEKVQVPGRRISFLKSPEEGTIVEEPAKE